VHYHPHASLRPPCTRTTHHFRRAGDSCPAHRTRNAPTTNMLPARDVASTSGRHHPRVYSVGRRWGGHVTRHTSPVVRVPHPPPRCLVVTAAPHRPPPTTCISDLAWFGDVVNSATLALFSATFISTAFLRLPVFGRYMRLLPGRGGLPGVVVHYPRLGCRFTFLLLLFCDAYTPPTCRRANTYVCPMN